MTCIVGYKNDSGAWVGGDGNWSWNDTRERMATPKVFFKDEAIWGVAGDPRTAQVLQYSDAHIDFPKFNMKLAGGGQLPDNLFTQFLAVIVVNYIQDWLRSEYCMEIDKDTGRESMSSSIIVAYKGMLREIRPHFGVFHPKEPYIAAGSGAEFAMGACYAMLAQNSPGITRNGENIVLTALSAAAKHEAHVSGPFTTLFSASPDYTPGENQTH